MTVQEAINKVIKLAEAQVGYKASADKHTKYTADLDALGDFYNGKKQWKGGGADWCDIFVDWLFVKSFGAETGRKMLYQPKKSTGAGCGYSANFYRQNGAFSKEPQLGSQIFYGMRGNESHTGIVVGIEPNYIWTVEGNVGGGAGQVKKKKVSKTVEISGYGIPNWSLVATNKKFTPQWGIDISVWQGNYDLAKAQKEGVKFCVLKGGGGDDGLYKDSRYEENYAKAKALGMPVGVYWFAGSPDNAKAEAEYFVKHCLKGKQFELPIYIDAEAGFLRYSKRKVTDGILTWLKYVRNAGYWVGIYSSTSAFAGSMYDSELKSYAHWVADWRGKCYYPNYYGMWQFGGDTNPIRSKYVAGKTTDQNYMYEDYPTEIKAKGLNGWSDNPPKPAPVPKFKLDEDGILGYNSVIAMQKWMGTYQDGYITGQLKAQNKYYPALINFKNGSGGSSCIKAMQNYLKKEGFSIGSYGADGVLGQDTIKALQSFLVKQGYSLGKDKRGTLGEGTAIALQKHLNKTVYK